MPNGLGFTKMACVYMARVVEAGGTTPSVSVQHAVEDLTIIAHSIFGSNAYAVYPLYGGNAASHAINLMGSKYTMVWVDTVTHSSFGITGDGATGYGSTGLNMKTVFSPVRFSFGGYVRSNSAADVYDMGGQATSQGALIKARTVAGNFVSTTGSLGGGVTQISTAVAASTGLFVAQRSDHVISGQIRNGVLLAQDADAWSVMPDLNFAVGAAAGLGTPSARNLAFAFVCISTSYANQTTWYNAVQAFQTTLGRQV